jgi:hypothetical protein
MASAFSGKNNFSPKSIVSETMTSNFDLKTKSYTTDIASGNMTSAFSGKNNFSTKSIGKRRMTKSAQMKKEQREKIREQFLRDLYTKDNSEQGFNIFEETENEPKTYRSEAKIQMGNPR